VPGVDCGLQSTEKKEGVGWYGVCHGKKREMKMPGSRGMTGED
jgi:uncharacterized membrane protein